MAIDAMSLRSVYACKCNGAADHVYAMVYRFNVIWIHARSIAALVVKL